MSDENEEDIVVDTSKDSSADNVIPDDTNKLKWYSEIFTTPIIVFLTFIMLIIAVISLWLSIFDKKTEITLTPFYRSLVSVDSDVSGSVQVSYNGSPVKGLALIGIKVENTGSVDLDDDLFDGPMVFSFDSDVEILKAEAKNTNPEMLRVSVGISNTDIIIEPLFFNSNDSFVMEATLITQGEDFIYYDTYIRILGGKIVRGNVLDGEGTNWIWLRTAVSCLLALVVLGLLLFLARAIFEGRRWKKRADGLTEIDGLNREEIERAAKRILQHYDSLPRRSDDVREIDLE